MGNPEIFGLNQNQIDKQNDPSLPNKSTFSVKAS